MNRPNRGKPNSISRRLRFENLEAREVFNAVNPLTSSIVGTVPDFSSDSAIVSPDSPHVPGCQCPYCQKLLDVSEYTDEADLASPENGPILEGPTSTTDSASVGINSLYPLSETFKLHSLPTATKVIYLDFDGNVTTGTAFNDAEHPTIVTPAFNFEGTPDTFTDNELTRIQIIWQRAAEKYSPFNVDVTTEDPGVEALRKTSSDDTHWGKRVAIGGNWTDWYGATAGGVSYVGDFDWSVDTPAFVFSQATNNAQKATAANVVHEVGHALGLSHQLLTGGGAYQGHHGANTPGWVPIMGGTFTQDVMQWSKGEYPGAASQADELAIITSAKNGFGYRPDDVGNTIGTARSLNAVGNSVNFNGIIETSADVDVLKFGTSAGKISFKLDPYLRAPTVDILAELLDSSGNVLISDNPTTSDVSSMSANINFTITTPGTYYLRVSGVGAGDLATGYSDYASIGQYEVTGTIVGSPTLAGLESVGVNYTEGDSSVPLTSLITVADDGSLSGASVSLVGFQPADLLTFTPVGSIVGTYDSSIGKLSLSGTGTPEQYQVVLRSVRYANTLATPVDGSRTIKFQVTDEFGNSSTIAARPLTILSVNDLPTLDLIPDLTINEDAAPGTINLAGISAGAGETQNLTIMATSDNPGLIPNPTVNYTSPNATGTLGYQVAPNASGKATITVTIRDDGGTTNGGVDVFVRKFVITVNPVNDSPTLNLIPDLTLNEDAPAGTISLAGIGVGVGESQTLTITATSDNPALIPNPAVTYTSPNATGTLGYQVVPNATGTATITVTLLDDGGTANGGINVLVRQFVITVNAVNDPPTLNMIPDLTLNEDTAPGTINLTGISAGLGSESQNLTITATSDNPALIPNPSVTYMSPNATGTLGYQVVPNASGKATITVTIRDDGGTTNGGVDVLVRKFVITVNAVNDPPTLNLIPDLTLNEDAAPGTINLTGIGTGASETQKLTITATSDNPSLIPNPLVTYTSPNATGTLGYQVTPNASGKATITVTVRDDGGTANGGVDVFVRTFVITVNPVNDPPTLNVIPHLTINEDAAPGTINLTGIGSGNSETQKLTITATSDNPALVANPTVNYTSPNATGTLGYQLAPNASGKAMITVTVRDDGGTTNGGVDVLVRTFVITVNPVNDAPTFSGLKDISLPKNSPAFSLPEFVTGISAGPANESSQQLTFDVVADKPELFAVLPTISKDGTLSFVPAPDAKDLANVSVVLRDDGGTANGGVDRSVVKTFNIALGVNRQPVLANGLISRINYVGGDSYNPPAALVSSFGLTGVTDRDTDNVLGAVAVIGVDTSHGQWLYSIDAGVSWADLSNASPSAARLLRDTDLLKFVPATGYLETAKLTYRAWDQSSGVAGEVVDLTVAGALGISSPFSLDIGTADVRVAPVIYSQNEDAATKGRKLNTWPGVNITDADGPKAKHGVAIVGSGGNVPGHWEYKVGVAWKPLIGMSPTDATLVRAIDSVRFVPKANQFGDAYLLYRAWDQTTGWAGSRVNTSDSVGGANAFSVDTDAFFFRVKPVNDRPVLDARAVATLNPVAPGDIHPAGDLVSTILGATATDADTGTVPGVAVTARGKIGGTWQYKLAAGGDWTNIPNVSAKTALLLGPTDSVRFVPSGSGGSSSLSYKAWDRTTGTAGDRVNSNVGTSFSKTVSKGTMPVTTTPTVNRAAEELNSPMATFSPVLEDTKTTGDSVAFLLGNSSGGNRLTASPAIAGIAVIGKTGTENGSWQYSQNGLVWKTIGDVSLERALLLKDTDKVRFVPNPNFAGPANATLSYRAWDRVRGTAGQLANLALPGNTGGMSPFGVNETIAAVNVTPVNDRPALNTKPLPTFHQVTPGDTNPEGDLVSFLLGSALSDADANSGRGIAISNASTTKGTWQYLLEGGTLWTNLPSLAAGELLLLKESDRIRFVPAASFVGRVSLAYRGWDASVGNAGEVIKLTNAGTSVSLATETATLNVGDKNVRPVLFGTSKFGMPSVVANDVASKGERVADVLGTSVFDANSGTLPGIAIVGADQKNGLWQYSLNGIDWSPIGIVNPTIAVVLKGDTLIRFVPKAGFTGSTTISYKAWDQSDHTIEGTKINARKSTAVSSLTQTKELTVNTAPTLAIV